MIQVKLRRRDWRLEDAINLGIFNPDDIPAIVDLIEVYGAYGFSDGKDQLFDAENFEYGQMIVNESSSYFEIVTK